MVKKAVSFAIVMAFIFSTLIAYAASNLDEPVAQAPMEKTKDRLSRGMNNIMYGPVEVPKNIDETKTKGTEIDRCSKKTRSGVERGIARVVGGIWQVATFWYSDPGCVTSSSQASSKAATK